jgi:isocitrate/isopropylmalate dehydrogenase
MLAGDGPRTRDLGGRATTAEVATELAASFARR